MNKSGWLFIFCLIPWWLSAQDFRFAHVSDTHVGSPTGAEDLSRVVHDINADTSLRFVVLSGDITEFGADAEIKLAKSILDSLQKPWYIIPGNHDGNWSESGGNTFRKVFGAETFRFDYGGYTFLGTYCGPNMRMSPGQVPRENIVWLDSTLHTIPDAQPIIYINHYPQDTSLNNWYDAIDLLKKKNIQLLLCGHGHSNRKMNFEGIPSIMGRSSLRAGKPVGGYNIVSITADKKIIYQEKTPGGELKKQWAEIQLADHHFIKDTANYFRPSYAVNKEYPQVKQSWMFRDKSDIGCGAARYGDLVIAANTSGEVYALNTRNGKKQWRFFTQGKIYSTPAVAEDKVVVGSADHFIYCLSAKSGKLLWKVAADKAVLGSPVIQKNICYIGASDGIFRAIDIRDGKLAWSNNNVDGFVVTKPLIYENKIYFGTWNRQFYALDQSSGKIVWQWDNGNGSRMYSPAACYPVAVKGRIFIVAPDRYMTCFDATDGKVIWRESSHVYRVRESMGISADSSLVYAKTMEGELVAFSAAMNGMNVQFHTPLQIGYELAPTAIIEDHQHIFLATDDGEVVAVNRDNQTIAWKHKVANCLVNQILPISKNKIIVTTMDGKVVCLTY